MRMTIIYLVTTVLCSCSPALPVPKLITPSTPTTVYAETLTFASPPINTVYASKTETIPYIKVSSLTTGEYIATGVSLPIEDTFIAIRSLDGEFKGYLAKVNSANARLSPNLDYIRDNLGIINLNTGERFGSDELTDCGIGSWSPDSKFLVVDCLVMNTSTNELIDSLYIFSLRDHSMTQITYNPSPKNNTDPSWSPDGKWIAYEGSISASGVSPYSGLHILDTKCFSSPSTCWRDEPGIDGVGTVWSPDSQFLAGGYGKYDEVNNELVYEVRISQIENGVVTFWKKYPMTSRINRLSWEPNGKRIAVFTDDGGYFLSVETSQFSPMNLPQGSTPFNWFIVP